VRTAGIPPRSSCCAMGCCSAGRLASIAVRCELPGFSRCWRGAVAGRPGARPGAPCCLPEAGAAEVPSWRSARGSRRSVRPAGSPGLPGPLLPGPEAGRGGRGERSARAGPSGRAASGAPAGRSGLPEPSGRLVRSGRSARGGRSAKGRLLSEEGRAPLLPPSGRAPALPLSPPGALRCDPPPGRGRSPRSLSRSPRSPPERLCVASWVVTVAVTGRSSNSIRLGSDPSGPRGGSTDMTVMPSMPKSASARTTSPTLAPLYTSAASSAPRGFSAPAARHVQVPSGRALVSSISIRRATAPRYNFAAGAQITGQLAGRSPQRDQASRNGARCWVRAGSPPALTQRRHGRRPRSEAQRLLLARHAIRQA
jgi:hypothetical protein